MQITENDLDFILALQFTVAWAGEGRCRPPRLAWWETDLVDPEGGGDFFQRLLPQTHAWAALEAVREAARRTDERARGRMAHPDLLRTLFFLGFEVDEQVGDRLAALKRGGRSPEAVLQLPLPLTAEFSRERLLNAVGAGEVPFDVIPGGRQLRGSPPAAPEKLARRLAAALVPFVDQYPMPFYLLQRGPGA